jgi:hypothetical protein
MAEDPNLDDDTSIGRVTQGGRRRQGRSVWWFLAVILVAAGALAFSAWLHRTAPADQAATSGGGAPSGAATGTTP